MIKRPIAFDTCCTRTEFQAAIFCAVNRAVRRGRRQQCFMFGPVWVIQDAEN